MGKLKEFSIILSRGSNAVYHPGSLVEGKVVLEISAPQNTKSISIVMSGKARVKFIRYVMEYSDHTEGVLSDVVRRLWGNGVDAEQIEAGRHEFPFSFQLPSDLPTSHELANAGTNRKGYIRYSLAATAVRSWNLKHHASASFTIEDHVSINNPQLVTSRTAWRKRERPSVCGFLTSGPISVSVETDKEGYYRGEPISLNVKVENNGNRRIIAVQAFLSKRITYYSRSIRGVSNRHESVIVGSIEGPGAEPGDEINWNDGVLPIPSNAALTLSNCRLVDLSYIVRVKVVIAWAKNIVVKIPIVIGNTSTQPTTATNFTHQPLTHPNTNMYHYNPTNPAGPVSHQPHTNTYHYHPTNLAGPVSYQPDGNTYHYNPTNLAGPVLYQPDTNACHYNSTAPMLLSHQQSDTNMYRPPPINPEFMSEQSSSLQPSVPSPGVVYPPVNTRDDQSQTKEAQFVPASDLVTNYNENQPPSYDSIYNT